MATEFRANVSTIADVRQSLHRLKSLNIPTFTPDATRAPTSDDDYNRGYRVPSFWCRDSDRLYVCVDDTPNNAVWIEIAGSSVGIPITDIANAGDGVSLVASPSSSGSTFQLRGLLSGHTALSIAAAGADDVLFDLDESAIDHGGLGGRDDDDHSAYVLAEAPFAVQDNRLTRWDGTGGRDIQSSIVSISDTGVVDGALSYGLQNADRILLLDGDQLRWGDGAGTCHPLIIASGAGAASVTLDPRNAGISDTGTINLLGRTFNIGATAATAVNIGQTSGTAIRVGGLDGYVFGTGGVLSAAAAIPLSALDLTGLDGAGLAFNGTALDAQVDGTTLEIVADVLQVVSGVYQPADATLDALAALTGAGVPQASGTDTWAMSTFAANRLVRGNSTTGLLENAGLAQAGDGALTPAALNTNLLLSGSGTGVVIVDDDLILNALIGAPGTARKLRLEEGDFNDTYVQLSAPQSVPVTFTLTFPAALPGATQFVNCTAAGQLGFADLDSGDIPDLSGTYVPHSLFDANTILKADSDNTPVALTVGEQTLVGRITAGSIAALTATEARTLLNVADGANAYVHPNHTGDVTSVADGATTIANDAVTTIKILNANVTLDKIVEAAASSVLLGSGDAGVGIPYAEITLGTNLSMSGTTLNASGGGASALDDLTDVTITLASAGDLLRHNGTAWVDDVLVAGDIPDLSATYSVVGHDHSGVYQPLDADLTAIAALDGPGVLVASGADTWAIQNPLTVASGGTGLATITADRLVTGAGTSALNITDFSLASGVIERTAAGAATLRAAAGSVSTFGRDEEGNIEVGPSAVTGTEYGIVPAVDGAVRPFHLGTTAKRFGEIHAYSLISLDADGDGSTVGTSFWGATQDAFAYWNNTDSVFTLGPAVQIDNLKLDGNTISATDTNGNVDAALAGTGNFRVTSGSVITNISALTCELNRSTRVRVGSLTTGAPGNEVLASLATSTTSTPSNGTTETTIASASLAANAFTGSEGVAVFHATGTATGSAPTKTFRVKVGGTTILDTGALSSMGAGSPGDWFVELRLWRTSATAYKYVAEFTTSDGSASLVEYFKKYGTGTVTNWTSANTIAVTVQFSAAGTDVTGEASLLVYEGRTTT